MQEIAQIRKLSLWIFLIRLLAINLCLIISQNPEFIENTIFSVDQIGRSIEVPELIPESVQEKERFEGALRRRQLSLVLAGKMKPSEATELKAIFD